MSADHPLRADAEGGEPQKGLELRASFTGQGGGDGWVGVGDTWLTRASGHLLAWTRGHRKRLCPHHREPHYPTCLVTHDPRTMLPTLHLRAYQLGTGWPLQLPLHVTLPIPGHLPSNLCLANKAPSLKGEAAGREVRG